MLAIVPRMPTVAATGFTTFLAPLFAMGADTTARVRAGGGTSAFAGGGGSHQGGKRSRVSGLFGVPLHTEDEGRSG
jgi:hypothetical protein